MNYIDGFPKTINEQIDSYTDTEKLAFAIKDSSNNTILTGGQVLDYLEHTYNCYKSQFWLHSLWATYQATHHADFLKAYSAVTADYDPLENYNGTETNIHQRMDGEETTTITHGKTVTNDLGNNGVTTVNQVSSVDNTSLRDDTKSIQKGETTSAESGTTETVKDTDVKSLTVGDTTYTADFVEAEQISKRGNLGIRSSQELIQQEIELRLKPLIMLYIDQFATTYLYYVSGGEFDNDCYIL